MTDEIPKDWPEQFRKQRAGHPKTAAEDCFRDLAQQFGQKAALAAFEAVAEKQRIVTHRLARGGSDPVGDSVLLERMLKRPEGTFTIPTPNFAALARDVEPNNELQEAMRKRLRRIWKRYWIEQASE